MQDLCSKQLLRKEIRQKRRSVSQLERAEAGLKVLSQLNTSSIYRSSRSIGVYFASDGEIPLDFVIRDIWKRKKKSCLPVLFGGKQPQMHFAEYHQKSRLIANKYKIPEPVTKIRKQINAKNLDLVLLPLVAFDCEGNRLGMGGGYYDRSFRFLLRRKKWRRPKLIGVAYDFQEVTSISSDSWDVPLSGIVTESRFFKFE